MKGNKRVKDELGKADKATTLIVELLLDIRYLLLKLNEK